MDLLEARAGQVVDTCQESGWSPSVSEGRVQMGQRGRWNLERCEGRGFLVGSLGWDSQSEVLSESEELEEEEEVGGGEPVGMRVRN